jgi:hypothetical protein
LLAVLSCIAGTNAWAYDFVADGIFYKILSSTNLTVEVTCENFPQATAIYVDDVVIPAMVENDGKTYNVIRIGQNAFYDCEGLTSIEIPSSVMSVGYAAFQNCKGLTDFTIPADVTSIEAFAFSGCMGLTNVVIPASVTNIGYAAFAWCSGLTSIEVASGNSTFDSRDNCNAIIGTISNILIAGCQNTVIPSGVTSIGEYAFSGCTGLTSIEIPDGVTSIGRYAFESCSGVTSIGIPSSVTEIGRSAFQECYSLTSVKIPSGVTSIGEQTFLYCSSMTDIEIPDGVTSIGRFAFQECRSLTSIEIPSSVTSIGNYAFHNCIGLTSIKIPSGVTSIGEWTFAYCRNLKNIEIPESVTTIDNYAFDGCSSLTEIKLPSGLTFIGVQLFNNCSGLTSLEIPNSVTSIGDRAFKNCTGLTSIKIPKDVTTIGNNAFENVRCVIYTGEATGSPWGAKKVYTTLPDEYGFYYTDEEKTQIEFYAGAGGDVVIPEGVTSLPNSLFQNCKGISSVTIPSSVTSIGESVFQGCTGLTSIEIPGSVTRIGSSAFYGCTGLIAIYLNSLVPPTIDYFAFDGLDKSQCTLYVPEGFESQYQSWGFQNIAVNPYVTVEKKAVIYMVDGEEYQRDSVAVTAAIAAIDAPTREGYTFSGWSEIPATMPDNDVTVTGTFTVNRYAVIYMVDGEEYRRDSVEYGATITLAENPTKESHDFSGWSGYPEDLTMPAGNVIITGAFQFNGLAGIAAATIGDEYFDLTGKPLANPQRGINLVRKADGTTRKIIVK